MWFAETYSANIYLIGLIMVSDIFLRCVILTISVRQLLYNYIWAAKTHDKILVVVVGFFRENKVKHCTFMNSTLFIELTLDVGIGVNPLLSCRIIQFESNLWTVILVLQCNIKGFKLGQ